VREIVLEENAVTLAENSGWLAQKLVIAGKRGHPDQSFKKRIPLPKGMPRLAYTLLVEFKRIGESPDGNQIRRHRELREHGQEVHVIDTFDDFERLLEWAEGEIKRISDALRR